MRSLFQFQQRAFMGVLRTLFINKYDSFRHILRFNMSADGEQGKY